MITILAAFLQEILLNITTNRSALFKVMNKRSPKQIWNYGSWAKGMLYIFYYKATSRTLHHIFLWGRSY